MRPEIADQEVAACERMDVEQLDLVRAGQRGLVGDGLPGRQVRRPVDGAIVGRLVVAKPTASHPAPSCTTEVSQPLGKPAPVASTRAQVRPSRDTKEAIVSPTVPTATNPSGSGREVVDRRHRAHLDRERDHLPRHSIRGPPADRLFDRATDPAECEDTVWPDGKVVDRCSSRGWTAAGRFWRTLIAGSESHTRRLDLHAPMRLEVVRPSPGLPATIWSGRLAGRSVEQKRDRRPIGHVPRRRVRRLGRLSRRRRMRPVDEAPMPRTRRQPRRSARRPPPGRRQREGRAAGSGSGGESAPLRGEPLSDATLRAWLPQRRLRIA